MNKQDILNKIEWHLEETEGENASGTFDQGYKEGCYHCEALIEQLDEPQKVRAKLAKHWHEDVGDCLWWNFSVEEPPYCGTPLDEDFPNYKTHFTELCIPDEVEKEPLYTVTINLDLKYHLAVDEGDDDEISTTLTTSHDVLGYRYFLTEKEIKSVDENLWPFAVLVEEVAE